MEKFNSIQTLFSLTNLYVEDIIYQRNRKTIERVEKRVKN